MSYIEEHRTHYEPALVLAVANALDIATVKLVEGDYAKGYLAMGIS